jgi:hypothetical protein
MVNGLRLMRETALDNTQSVAHIPFMNKAAQQLGRLGGKAGTGKAKARTSEQARAAVMARWNKPGARKIGPKAKD